MGVGKIPKLGTCELFFSFTGAFDQLLGIEVPQASKTSVHCCYVQLSQNILSYTTYLPDCIPKLSRVFIACGMTGIGNSLERRLHTVVASLTQHGRYAFEKHWGCESLGRDVWSLATTLVQVCAKPSFFVSVIAHWIPKVKWERTCIVTPYVPLGEERRIGGGWRKEERGAEWGVGFQFRNWNRCGCRAVLS